MGRDRLWLPESLPRKIAATANLRNERSWRVIEKLGMKREGLFRSQNILRGNRMDEVAYGVLRKEWEQQNG